MLESIKRWLAGTPPPSGFGPVQAWAEGQGYQFKLPREGEGFVIEAANTAPPWRLEWGASQREYIAGRELRLRGEVGASIDLQMLLVSHGLMETLERKVYEHFVEGLQTRIDGSTPEEMRWLVLYSKTPADELKGLRGQFGGTSNVPHAVGSWLAGALPSRLTTAHGSWLGADDPLAFIVQRGRLTMRALMPAAEPTRIAAAAAVFHMALREARRVAEETSHEQNSTQPSLWGQAPGNGPPS